MSKEQTNEKLNESALNEEDLDQVTGGAVYSAEASKVKNEPLGQVVDHIGVSTASDLKKFI